jgi:hypothetical protein
VLRDHNQSMRTLRYYSFSLIVTPPDKGNTFLKELIICAVRMCTHPLRSSTVAMVVTLATAQK